MVSIILLYRSIYLFLGFIESFSPHLRSFLVIYFSTLKVISTISKVRASILLFSCGVYFTSVLLRRMLANVSLKEKCGLPSPTCLLSPFHQTFLPDKNISFIFNLILFRITSPITNHQYIQCCHFEFCWGLL